MVISSSDIYSLCCIVAEQRHLKVCVTESAKAGVITGGVTFVSALMLGPFAIVPAAAVGGLIAHTMSKKYVPLCQILADMSSEDKEKLCDHIRQIVAQLEITDGLALLAIATAPADSIPYARIMSGMGAYFRQQW